MATKRVQIEHRGGMRFDALTSTGHTLVFDDADGGAGPGPVEALLCALAACTAMDVISIALKKRQDVVRYAVHATAEQREAYPKVFTRVDLVHEVEGPGVDSAAIRRCIELSARTYCPISNMIAAGLAEIHHRYRIVRPGALPEEGEVLVTGPGWPLDVVA